MRIKLTFALLLLLAGNAFSQWELVAPGAIPIDTRRGILIHVQNVLWVGNDDLRMSKDTGKTWKVSTPLSIRLGDYITSITFWDMQIGLVGTGGGRIFITHNEGMDWKEITPSGSPQLSVTGIAFMGTPDHFAIGSGSGDIYTTTDGGNFWSSQRLVVCVFALISGNGNTLYAIGGDQTGSNLYKTTDYGQSWIPSPGKFDWDSYSFALDRCQQPTFYVLNEDIASPTDRLSCVYVSTDEGTTWVAKDQHQINYHCGSITLGGGAVFTQTYNGITRSTDRGATWMEIGGPPNTLDTRFVTALSENVIVAVDNNGSVWRTFNSGGDSVRNIRKIILTVSSDSLFQRDTIWDCQDIKRSKHITASGCPLPRILSNTIQGVAANDYSNLTTLADTLREDNLIELEFTPTATGYREAVYRLTLEDGQVISIPLAGNVRPSLSISVSSQKIFHTDTIGGLISIPITITGLDKPRDVEMTMHYDLGLDYIGTTSLSGKRLDIAGSASPGIVKILIPASEINLNGISAYANFNVFPDSVSSWNVWFDSLLLPNANVPCANQGVSNFTATITAPKGCGIGTITKFVRTGMILFDRIVPNPTRGAIDVRFTLPADDVVSFELVDMNGVVLRPLASGAFLTGFHTLHFDLSGIASGSYLVKMTNAAGYSLVQKFVNNR